MAPVERKAGENPYEIQRDLQEVMQSLVGIIRTESELKEAVVQIGRLEERAARVGVPGSLTYNPGWHLALDLQTSSRSLARSRSPRSSARRAGAATPGTITRSRTRSSPGSTS